MSIVLGIESSCDETGVGLVAQGQLLGQALASSMAEHARFGGVVPEVAARAHVLAIGPTIRAALADASLDLAAVQAIAVTSGPGLASSLTVGVAAAKALALSLNVPLYGVHHAAGHVAADTLEHGDLPPRSIVLIVSGGHTSLLLITDLAGAPIIHVGDTLDDAAGESFDKVARLLGLGYPGGPALSRSALLGDPQAVKFPRPLLNRPGPKRFAFSFSGLKSATARCVEEFERSGATVPIADIAASFQEAVVDVLTLKAVAAAQEYRAQTLVIVGGVAANGRLREVAAVRCAAAGLELRIPQPSLCTDNGAMIAAVGDLLVRANQRPNSLALDADPSVVLAGSQLA